MNILPSKPPSELPDVAPLAQTSYSELPRRRDNRDREASARQPQASGPVSENSTVSRAYGTVPVMFEDGEDFIPFGILDDELESVQVVTRSREYSTSIWGKDKGKGRAQDESHSAVDSTKELSKAPLQVQDKKKNQNNQRERNWERDHDRDNNRTGNLKRKYALDPDPDDDYASKKQRTNALSRKAPWVIGLDWDHCNNVAEMLHCEVKAFVNWISPTAVEHEVRGLVVSLISKVVTSSFPDAQVIPFGSYETKLYLPLGDIDLVILSDSMAYSDKVTVLHALANVLKREEITSKVTIIAKAKVPIVKFITLHGRFNVDISINQLNGVTSGKIVNGFINNDLHGRRQGSQGSLALRSLVIITKAFLSQRSMNEVYTGGLGSYSIVCLAISFLQMHPKIRRGEIDADKNLGVLLMEFFELYGCYFNYEEVGISVRDGGTYFSKRQRGWYEHYKGNFLSIEDPADPSNDISKGSYGFPKVRATFAGAHGILTTTAYQLAGIISSNRQGRSVRLRGQFEPDNMSILCSVMGITQETINHRKLVQEVYDSRKLHNSLRTKVSATNGNSGADHRAKVPSKSQGARSVQSTWHEATAVADSDDEHKHQGYGIPVDGREQGRYDIGRRETPKKRRKTGNKKDMRTVFTTDDDDFSTVAGEDDSLDEEEEEYASGEHQGLSSTDPGFVDKRRSYWLSKGIGIGEVD